MVKQRTAPRVDLRSIFLDHQRRMAGQLAAGLKHLTHPTVKGDAAESAWLKLLDQYLPERYRAMKAFVLDCKGTASEQIDVVIFDRQYSPFMWVHDGARYVPAESVYCVFEVRPNLTRATLEYAGKKVRSVRSLKRTSARIPDVSGVLRRKKLYRVLGGILTLNSSIRMDGALADALQRMDGDSSLDIGCVLNERSFVVDATAPQHKRKRIVISDSSESLIFFFLKLLERLQRLGTAPAMEIPVYSASLRSR